MWRGRPVTFNTILSNLARNQARSQVGISDSRGTLLTTKRLPLGLYGRPMRRAQAWSQGEGRFLMSEAPLYRSVCFNRSVCVVVKKGVTCRVESESTSRSEKGRNMSLGRWGERPIDPTVGLCVVP